MPSFGYQLFYSSYETFMKTTHSYPLNRFAIPDPPQVAPVRAARPSPAQSGRALPDKGGPGDASAATEPQTGADKGAGRPILHLNIQP